MRLRALDVLLNQRQTNWLAIDCSAGCVPSRISPARLSRNNTVGQRKRSADHPETLIKMRTVLKPRGGAFCNSAIARITGGSSCGRCMGDGCLQIGMMTRGMFAKAHACRVGHSNANSTAPTSLHTGLLAKTYRGESLTSCCSKTVACPTLVAIIGCQPKTFCSQVDAGQDVVRPSDSV